MPDKNIFREKSIERVSSPEQLDDYIRVISPGIWMVICAILLLLIAILAWAVFGTIPVKTADGAVRDIHAISYLLN
ncbi:MAG: hypothetical protein K6B41_13060 [Butyrivibrio sp.]|nr:hypothetical protein [Butyrivibrio sp.]